MPVTYPWKRFWCPADGSIGLDDAGYMADPEGPYARYLNREVVSFDAIAPRHCLILLGEPGIGKSFALQSERAHLESVDTATGDAVLWIDLKDYGSDDALHRALFESPTWQRWQESDQQALTVFIDGVDEGLIRLSTLARLILRGLERVPVERLWLRIACRTADWPATLGERLQALFGKEHTGFYELAPLRERDAEEAARASSIDAEGFLNAVRSCHVGPLAARPVTLQFLLDSYARHGTLADSRGNLYEQGCLYLCEEPDRERREAAQHDLRFVPQLSAAQRLVVASRVAAVMLLSSRRAVHVTDPPGNAAAEDMRVEQLSGGTEVIGTDRFEVRERTIREVLATGLFTSRGVGRLGWSHQTYAEFLAAHYLNSRPLAQVTALLGRSDETGRYIVPQLEETAAWLAGMRTDVFDWIFSNDYRILLRSDIAALDPHLREALVGALMAAFATETIPDSVDLRSYYRRLAHPRLALQLKPFVVDRSQSAIARRAAIDIAEACGEASLQDTLLTIALDSTEPHYIRSQAAHAVFRLADRDTKRRLFPLAQGQTGDDPNDDLRGIALKALWPEHLGARQLVDCLTEPTSEDFVGHYRDFLHNRLIEGVSDQDLPVLLEAATPWPSRSPRVASLGEVSQKLVSRALGALETPGVAPALARLALARLRRHEDVLETDRPSSAPAIPELPDTPRRQLARLLLNETDLGTDEVYVLLLKPFALQSEADVLWMLDEIVSAPADRQAVWARAIERVVVDNFSSTTLERLHDLRDRVPALRSLAETWLDAWPLDSERARKAKADHEQLLELQRPKPRPRLEPPPAERIETQLRRLEADELGAWSKLVVALGLRPDSERYTPDPLKSLKESPGWKSSTPETQRRIVDAASRVVHALTLPGTEWFGTGELPHSVYSAYAALELATAELDTLPDPPTEGWGPWVPVVVGYFYGAPRHAELACLLYEAAPEQVIEWTVRLIRSQSERGGGRDVLQLFKTCWDDRLAQAGLEVLRSGDLAPSAFLSLGRALMARGVPEVLPVLADVVRSADLGSGSAAEHVVAAAVLLLTHDPNGYWDVVWPLFERHEQFSLEVLKALAREHMSDRGGFQTLLAEERLGLLYVWMSARFPPSSDVYPAGVHVVDDTERLRELRNSLLFHLVNRGTRDACRVLATLVEQLPDQRPFINWRLAEAVENARRRLWRPLAPQEVLELLRDKDRRYVDSEGQLVAVLEESLARLQERLQGTWPAAIDLWSYEGAGTRREKFRPKDEEDLSDYIARWVDIDLGRSSGIVVNREVQPRRVQKTDVHVDAIARRSHEEQAERITVVLEVKGCWNPEWQTGFRSQLVDRYLLPNGIYGGIFVVGAYACEAWTAADSRKKHLPKMSIAEMQRCLDLQADDVRRALPDLQVAVRVLDLRIPLGTRPAEPKARRFPTVKSGAGGGKGLGTARGKKAAAPRKRRPSHPQRKRGYQTRQKPSRLTWAPGWRHLALS